MEDVIHCGCTRILTSGQHPSVYDGITLVTELVMQAQNRIIIMPGSGLNSKNVHEIAHKTGAREFHTAARIKYTDPQIVSPGSMNEQLSFISVDKTELRYIREALNSPDK